MRKLLTVTSAVLGAALLSATSASASARWSCDGPEYVCGSSSSASSSYSANDERPARASKSKSRQRDTEVATYSGDEDRPRRRRTRETSYEGGGGGGETGQASYYWQPQRLASGGWFNPNAFTAAHKTLPFGTRVLVTNRNNGQSVEVVINDRGPYVAGRIIDLSSAAAGAINMKGSGVVPVSVTVLGRS